MNKPKETLTQPEAVLQRMLAKDNFTRLLGIEVDEVGEGYCRLHMKVREDMLNGFGTLHGGVSYSAADSALAFACNSHGRLSMALSTTMEYMEAGKLGDTIYVEAKEESLKNRIGVYLIRVTNQEGVLIALFKGTAYRTTRDI